MDKLEKISIALNTFSECVEDAGRVEHMAIFCITQLPEDDKSVGNQGIIAGAPKDLGVMLMSQMSRNRVIRDLVLASALMFPKFDSKHGDELRKK